MLEAKVFSKAVCNVYRRCLSRMVVFPMLCLDQHRSKYESYVVFLKIQTQGHYVGSVDSCTNVRQY